MKNPISFFFLYKILHLTPKYVFRSKIPIYPHRILSSTSQVKDKRVNLELENAFNKDNGFIGIVKKSIDKNNIRRDFSGSKLEKFTDFVQNVIEIILKFEDGDLEDFFTIVSDEIRKYQYRDCKFHELIESYGLRKFITNGLSALEDMPARNIRNNILLIAEKLEMERYDSNERELVDFINSMYKQKAVDKFRNILISFDDYRLNSRNENISLVKVVREGIQSIIFDHYTELNHYARKALKSKMEEYFKYLMDLSNTLASQLNAEEIRLRSCDKDQNKKTVKDLTKSKEKVYKTEKPKTGKRLTFNTVAEKSDIHIDLKIIKYERSSHKYTKKDKNNLKKNTFKMLYPKFNDFIPKYRPAVIALKSSQNINQLILQEERDGESQIERRPRVYAYPVSESVHNLRNRKQRATKIHKHTRTTRQINFEKDIALQLSPYPYKLTTANKLPSTLTFMMLYPVFDKETRQTLWHKEMHKPRPDILPKGNSGILQLTNKGILEVETIKPFATKIDLHVKKLKSTINLKTHDIQCEKSERVTKNQEFNSVTARSKYSDPNFNVKPRWTFENLKLTAVDISKINIKSTKKILANANLGYLGELVNKLRRTFGDSLRNIPNNGVAVNKHILTRLQKLEREVENVKRRLNDTETVTDLKKKVNRKHNSPNEYELSRKYTKQHNYEHNTKPLQEVVFDLTALIDLDDGRLGNDFDLRRSEKTTSNMNDFNSYLINLHNTDQNINRRDNKIKNKFSQSTLNKYKNRSNKVNNRERLTEWNTNENQYKNGNISKNNHLDLDPQDRFNVTTNKSNKDMDRTNNWIYENRARCRNKSHLANVFYDYNHYDYKRHMIDTMYDLGDRNITNARENNGSVIKNRIQEDIKTDGRLKLQTIDQTESIRNITSGTDKYELSNLDNDKLKMNDKVNQISNFINETHEIYSNATIRDVKNKIDSKWNTGGINYTVKQDNYDLTHKGKYDKQYDMGKIKDDAVITNGLGKNKPYDDSKNVNNQENHVEYDFNKGDETNLNKKKSTHGNLTNHNYRNLFPLNTSQRTNAVVFKSNTKEVLLNEHMEETYTTKTGKYFRIYDTDPKQNEEYERKYNGDRARNNTIKTRSDSDKKRLHERNEKVHDSENNTKVEYKLSKNGSNNVKVVLKGTNSTQKINKYVSNASHVLLDKSQKRSNIVVKYDPNKDDEYMEHNHYSTKKEVKGLPKQVTTQVVQVNKDIGRNTPNHNFQRAQQLQYIADDKLNKYRDRTTENSTTTRSNYQKNTNVPDSDFQIETRSDKRGAVQKEALIDVEVSKENNNNTNLGNNRVNRTAIATTTTIYLTTIKNKTNPVSVSPSAIRRMLTNATHGSVTTDPSIAVLSSNIPGPYLNDYSIPGLNEPFEGAIVGYGQYDEMRRLHGAEALQLLREFPSMFMSSTPSPNDIAGNKTVDFYREQAHEESSERDWDDYQKQYGSFRNISQNTELPFVPPPGFVLVK